MLALLAPGQGSQKPGFLAPWLEVPGATDRLRSWSDLIDLDLVALGTTANAEEITDTAKTQPLLVAASLLAAEHLSAHKVGLVAGHSVGELAAAALAGVLSSEDAIRFAAARGREMAAACAASPTGMSAVMGGDPCEVTTTIDAAGAYPANINGAGQVVAAGDKSALEALAANPPSSARVRPLAVAGAFHTPFMAPARDKLASLVTQFDTAEPQHIWLSNADGSAMASAEQAMERLVGQVTLSVRWDECMATMADRGVTGIIELPPAGTLAGLAKRAMDGVEIIKINKPTDLGAAHDLIHRHTEGTS